MTGKVNVEWSADDQARADQFAEQVGKVAAQLRGGHPDVVVVAFVQTTSSLMRQRLRDNPEQLRVYARLLQKLVDEVLPRPLPEPTMRH